MLRYVWRHASGVGLRNAQRWNRKQVRGWNCRLLSNASRIENENENDVDERKGICAAYCAPFGLSVTCMADRLRESIVQRGCNDDVKVYMRDVVHIGFVKDDKIGRNKEYESHGFLFSSGAMVFWNISDELRGNLIRLCEKCGEGEKDGLYDLSFEEFDHEFSFILNNKRDSGFLQDEMIINDFNKIGELLAFSYGLAQSVKLMIHEEQIDGLVLKTRELPEMLAKDGHIRLTREQVKRLMGELLMAKYAVNLVSDVLDTPEYFWNHPKLERLYHQSLLEVQLRQRVNILDDRVQVIQQALDLLNTELSTQTSDRVERAILALITVEVVIELLRLF